MKNAARQDSTDRLLAPLTNILQQAEKGLEIFKKPSSNRNFDIILQSKENMEYLILLKKKGSKKIKDLSCFLPRGAKFIADEEFSCQVSKKRVFFVKDELMNCNFLLSLGHEIGHCWQKAKPYRTIISLFKIIWENASSEDILNQEKARNEKNAWKFSIKMLKKLREEGFSVFEELGTKEQVNRYIFACLLSYEAGILLEHFRENIKILTENIAAGKELSPDDLSEPPEYKIFFINDPKFWEDLWK